MRIGLLGGSFNPVHIGHLRLCLEMLEQAGLDRVELVPAFIPPHKELKLVLPFDLRRAMLEGAIEGKQGMEVNCMEKERPGPSYTFDTLQAYIRDNPGHELFFILGDSDLFTVPKWHRGREIAYLSNLLVIGREGEESGVAGFTREFWNVRRLDEHSWQLKEGREIKYLSVPRLDISSTMIRTRWLAGRSIDWLVPRAVQDILDAHAHEVRAVWQ